MNEESHEIVAPPDAVPLRLSACSRRGLSLNLLDDFANTHLDFQVLAPGHFPQMRQDRSADRDQRFVRVIANLEPGIAKLGDKVDNLLVGGRLLFRVLLGRCLSSQQQNQDDADEES
jgi:hypothetical protein